MWSLKKSKNKIFSIVIPYYNGGKYLDGCLAQIAKQDKEVLSKTEIIIIDNNSNKENVKILKRLVRKYNFKMNIQVHRATELQGCGYARNVGMQYASGDYVGFIDCDDIVAHDMLISFYEAYLAIPYYRGYPIIESQITWSQVTQFCEPYLDEGQAVHGKMYSTAFIREYGLACPHIPYHEDTYFNRMCREAMQVHNYTSFKIYKALYHYIEREDSIVLSKLNHMGSYEEQKKFVIAHADGVQAYMAWCFSRGVGMNCAYLLEVFNYYIDFLDRYHNAIDTELRTSMIEYIILLYRHLGWDITEVKKQLNAMNYDGEKICKLLKDTLFSN